MYSNWFILLFQFNLPIDSFQNKYEVQTFLIVKPLQTISVLQVPKRLIRPRWVVSESLCIGITYRVAKLPFYSRYEIRHTDSELSTESNIGSEFRANNKTTADIRFLCAWYVCRKVPIIYLPYSPIPTYISDKVGT